MGGEGGTKIDFCVNNNKFRRQPSNKKIKREFTLVLINTKHGYKIQTKVQNKDFK